MTDKEVVKQAFAEAENDAKSKQIKEVKAIVTKTLEKLADIRKQIKELQDKEKVLKLDIDDLKEGRLDRIAERQEVDPEAKKVSVVYIIKEKIVRDANPWYWPYVVTWPTTVWPSNHAVYYNNSCGLGYELTSDNSGFGTTANLSTGHTINCSITKDAAIGAYNVNGTIINLR